MAHLRRNEHLKLFANCCNTLATTVFSLGILTPIAGRVWDSKPLPYGETQIFFACLLFAIATHLLGQWFITGLKDVEDE